MSSTTPLKRVYLSIPEMTSLIMDYSRLKKKGFIRRMRTSAHEDDIASI
jgi:hypothetical protein